MSQAHSAQAQCNNLMTFSKQIKAGDQLKVEGIHSNSTSLKTRLLELGLVRGASFKAFRNGSHILIKLRGDTLLLRANEAKQLLVSAC